MRDIIDIIEKIQLKLAKERGITKCTNYVGGARKIVLNFALHSGKLPIE